MIESGDLRTRGAEHELVEVLEALRPVEEEVEIDGERAGADAAGAHVLLVAARLRVPPAPVGTAAPGNADGIAPPARGDVDLEVLVVLADRVVGAAVVDAGVGHYDVLDGQAHRELVYGCGDSMEGQGTPDCWEKWDGPTG